MPKLIPVLLCLITTITLQAAEQSAPQQSETPQTKQVELKYKFAKGDQWHYQLREKGTQEAISPGGTQIAQNDSSQWKHYRILETYEDGSALMEIVVDRYKIDFKVLVDDKVQKTIAYDTNQKSDPPKELKGVKNSIGKPFATVKMTSSGEILEMKLSQETEGKKLDNTQQRQGLPLLLPSEPIAVGDSWTDSLPVQLPVTPFLKKQFNVQTIYQLKSVDASQATIELNTLVQPRLTDPALRGRMMQYLPKGIIVFDLKHGRIISRTEKINGREIGVGGPKTAMQVTNQKLETLIEADQKVSQTSP